MKRLSHSGEEVDDLAKYSYSGKELDETTNLYYFNARFYDATIGRFINVDPVQDGLNWIVYCNNNPLCFVDPTGLTKETMEAAKATWEEQDAKNNPNPAASDQVFHTDELLVRQEKNNSDTIIEDNSIQNTGNEFLSDYLTGQLDSENYVEGDISKGNDHVGNLVNNVINTGSGVLVAGALTAVGVPAPVASAAGTGAGFATGFISDEVSTATGRNIGQHVVDAATVYFKPTTKKDAQISNIIQMRNSAMLLW